MMVRMCSYTISQEGLFEEGTKIKCPRCGAQVIYTSSFKSPVLPGHCTHYHFINAESPSFKNKIQDLTDGILIM